VKFEWRKQEGQLRVVRLTVTHRGEGERVAEGDRPPKGRHGEGDRPKERPVEGDRPKEPAPEGHGEGDRPKERKGEGDAPKPEARPVQTGTVVGVVTAKGENGIAVKADGAGEGEKYVPRWIGGVPADGGGFDRLMLKTFAGLKVGDRVKIEWLRDEHLRAVKIEPADAPK
jgi:hypothetical protein